MILAWLCLQTQSIDRSNMDGLCGIAIEESIFIFISMLSILRYFRLFPELRTMAKDPTKLRKRIRENNNNNKKQWCMYLFMLLFIYTFSLLFLYLFPINKYIYYRNHHKNSNGFHYKTITNHHPCVCSDGRNEMDVIVLTRTCTQIN